MPASRDSASPTATPNGASATAPSVAGDPASATPNGTGAAALSADGDQASTATNNDSDAAATANPAIPLLAPQASAPKPSARDREDDAAGDASASLTDDGTVAGTESQAQAATNPAQLAAAAVVVNEQPSTLPTSTNVPTTIIGESTKVRAKSWSFVAVDPGASAARDATDAAETTQAPSAAVTDGTSVAASSSDDGAKTQAAKVAAAPQMQPQAVDNSAPPAQTDASAPTDVDHATAQTGDLSAISSSGAAGANAQGSTSAANVDANGLPNFGFSASLAPTSSNSAAIAPAGATSAAAVPIAGLAVAIAARAQAGSNQFDIRLDPPELGRIDVRLDINRDGQATTHMTADRADTLALLQSQQPQLERALEQAGLKTADNSLQFTLRDQSFAGQNNGSSPQTSGAAQLVVPDPDLIPVAVTQIYSRVGLGGGVDIRV